MSNITDPQMPPLAHHGATGTMVRLALVNAVFNVLTLTLWRFWGKTRVRRALWGDTTAWGDPVEYTGTGKELFLGFLMVFALIVAPMMTAFIILRNLAMEQSPYALLILPLQLLIFFLVGVGTWRARRYQLSRTVWRGIRGGLSGQAWKYGLIWLGVMLASIPTLGWALPWGEMLLARRRLNHTTFGDRKFICTARSIPVYGPFAMFWILLATFVWLSLNATFPALTILVIVGVPTIAFAYVAYRAEVWRQLVDGTRFDGATFQLDADMADFAYLGLINGLISILSLGLLKPWVALRTFRFACARLKVTGTVDFDTVNQSTAARPRRGEGLIAALDGAGDF